jgi:hypothetical protein
LSKDAFSLPLLWVANASHGDSQMSGSFTNMTDTHILHEQLTISVIDGQTSDQYDQDFAKNRGKFITIARINRATWDGRFRAGLRLPRKIGVGGY